MNILTHVKRTTSVAAAALRRHPGRPAVALAAVGMLALAGALPASASSGSDLSASTWKIYTIQAATNTWSNMSNTKATDDAAATFDFQQYDPAGMGLDSVYLLTNVAKSDLSNTTITAKVSVTTTGTALFYTRSKTCANNGTDAYVRLEFQSTRSGPYSPSDYWWSTGVANNLNLSTLANQGPGTLQFSTANQAAWSNINGQNGADPTAGFADALKNVKQVGVAFGSACSYASGVAIDGGTGSFHLLSYTLG